ncbi:zinc finger C3H1 domain-containing protein [Chanos chanos]|uniref:Zinc finger C3H1 domain-containing protein n=1 Tax=Chanos chanos TaxID=29144 RepID=A0A6J2V2J4_CHACN|nr:zinc finger C3H1 domain-containing protein [Chanos chanos]
MDLNSNCRSPREEGELEDGEICDDETDEKQLSEQGMRPSSTNTGSSIRCSRKPKSAPRNQIPIMGPAQDFRAMMPFNRATPLHGPFPPCHRQQIGPSGPDRLQSGQSCDPSPRSSFWERSHNTLGRFKYRGKSNEGRGDWGRGGGVGRENGRPPQGRFLFGDNHANRNDSPTRKQKLFGRAQGRKPVHSVAKPENGEDESFEMLLMKYKQIQLELECIRKEEKMALEPSDESPQTEAAVSITTLEPSTETGSIQNEAATAEPLCPEKAEKKVFQAFNLKPLRQKLLRPAEMDALNAKTDKEPQEKEGEKKENEMDPEEELKKDKEVEDDEEESESDMNISCVSKESDGTPLKVNGKDDDDELSELQLRLLALQSASRKWQQKEQQVMKESKEKITKAKASQEKSSTPPERAKMTTRSAAAERARAGLTSKPQGRGKAAAKLGPKTHPGKKTASPGSAGKQAWRKQQVHTWKLQHQREQEEQRRRLEEEEERRKREDEIRKIRDLSNQDEQYNRFMKLVGGNKHRSRSKSADIDHRKSLSKQGVDNSGNLYQYDNYDEVAMETDSETNSPAASPAHDPFSTDASAYIIHAPAFSMDVSPLTVQYLDPLTLARAAPLPPLPPLPPPDEPEQPPKPPFADEEEEEEMLLREELLKSLANKRALRTEDTSNNSGPPSPAVKAAVKVLPRSNLTAVNLNTVVPQTRVPNKFTRGPPAPRPPLMLPKHKAVVVRLNASDDSDSDGEASCSIQNVFGGLESMIKEARRTAEAAKPKGSISEKENNPIKTPDTLPDEKKFEYRLLKEEIASREKQKVLKLSPVVGVLSPIGSDTEVDAAAGRAASLQLAEAEDKLIKHKAHLQKDEQLLKHLLQQEVKKKESLKAAEAKVAKLKEQLLASEKIVNANKLLLKKLQEQVHRVQHRVALKKNQALRLERDLAQVQANTGGHKRKNASSLLSPSKLLRVEGSPRVGSERHYAELIAQKKRLQQLESEYALKIQKLKEAQALRQAEPRQAAPQPPSRSFPLSQPSLHDLTQDKLTLASEDTEAEEEELFPAAGAAVAATGSGSRRRSFRESGSFTKPKLGHSDQAPAAPVPSALAKEGPGKPTQGDAPAACLPELLLGLNVEDLKRRYQQPTNLGKLLEDELRTLQGALETMPPSGKVFQVDFDPMAVPQNRGDLKPVSFGPYRSPLLVFKSYRFSPYFRTKEKLSLSSVSFSNVIDAQKCFCRFDLTGTCNDDDCKWQHMRNCTFSGNQLFQDILSYSLPLIGCSENSSTNEISRATEKYLKKLFGANKDRMGMDQKAVLLVSKVNESLNHIPPYTTYKEKRKWRPEPQKPKVKSGVDNEEDAEDSLTPVQYDERCSVSWAALDTCVTQDDKRYFDSETDDISNLESSVLESPRDVQLWIKLAFKYLSQKETTPTECLDAALNTLSRALEDNQDHPEVWCHYLSLFSRRGTREEVEEMCDMAVDHAPDYEVWWTYLNIESTFERKESVCERLLQYLVGEAERTDPELHSFRLLESLLYRVQLNLFTGRKQKALVILEDALRSSSKRRVVDLLRVSDRCLAWLCYIHVTEFGSLPSALYDPANSNPSRIVCTEPFLFPWHSSQDIRTSPDQLMALFEDAVQHCTDGSLTLRERTLACLPLHRNLIKLHQALGKQQEAVTLCETLLRTAPCPCLLLETLSDLHMSSGDVDKAAAVWLHAFSQNTQDAQIFYQLCKCLVAQDKSGTMEPLFHKFMTSFCETAESEQCPINVLRHILGIDSQDLQGVPRIKEELASQLCNQLPYLNLVYCLWQSVHGSVGEAVDAFERALGTIMKLEIVHQLWLDYLLFTRGKIVGPQPGGRELKVFTDLVQRCLLTVPTRLTRPFSTSQYWSSFRFHNKVISFYLGCLPQSQHSLVLERLRYLMSTNTELAIRLLQLEWRDGNIEHLKLQIKMLSSSVPHALAIWEIAIAVEREQKGRTEVQRLYQQALQKLPLCATLWKDCLLFEAAEGGKTDTLKKLVDKCQEVGVSLSEPLSLGPCKTEGKDH